MSSVFLVVLAAVGAFFIGRFAERARTAHQMYSSYRSRVGSSFRSWIHDSFMALLIGAGTVLIVVTVFLR